MDLGGMTEPIVAIGVGGLGVNRVVALCVRKIVGRVHARPYVTLIAGTAVMVAGALMLFPGTERILVAWLLVILPSQLVGLMLDLRLRSRARSESQQK